MLRFLLYPLVLLLVFSGSSARVAPSFITPCPGLKSDCLKKVTQETLPIFSKGIPELGVASIDPLKQDNLKITLPGNLKVEFYNGTLTGLRKCTFDSVTYKDDAADLKMRCDLTIKGQYKANGRVLIVGINGDGNAKIKLKNMALHMKIKFEDKVRDGVVYYEVKKVDVDHDWGDKVTFSLTNLFQGNPELSETVLQFLNQNSKQVVEEFGQPIVDELVDLIVGIVKVFFRKVPKEEIFIQ